MNPSQRVKNIVPVITKFLERLDTINSEARASHDYQAGYERLFHWKGRVTRFLRENVSSKEADNLSQKGNEEGSRSVLDFGDDVNLYRSILVAIIEALEDNPEYILEDVSPIADVEGMQKRRARYKYDVFISYSTVDKEQANIIYDEIIKVARQAFLSEKSLSPGQAFAEEIRKNLIASKELWLLVSPHSLKSEWVLTEWGAAWVLQKKIVPILYRCRPEELPDRLRNLQSIDLHKITNLVHASFTRGQSVFEESASS